MPEVDLVRAARQAMEDDEHGPVVIGADLGEIFVGEVGSPRRERFIHVRVWVYHKVDGKGARVSLVVGVEYLSAVVDGRAVFLDGGPHGLRMAIEEQRIELARRYCRFAHLQQIGSGAIFFLQW